MAITLWALPKGTCSRVQTLDGALPQAHAQRLRELGFFPGAEVRCVHRPAFGAPRVYAVAGACFSLEKALAARIYTEPCAESPHGP
ncbi:MAG: hypothetical protein RLZZ174_441 [Pseudomonadota bacterium]|jgi:Fe2+ transport system protein FeoA|nr:ferrous iron transport protein A [Pseudomonadales bacterium]